MDKKNFIKDTILPLLGKQDFNKIENLCRDQLAKSPNDNEILQYYALSLFKNEKINESIKVYRQIIDKDKNSLMSYLNLAKIYYFQKKYRESENCFKEAKNIQNSYEVLVELGKFYKNTNNKKNCEEILIQALQKKNKGIEAHILLGELYYENKDFLSAINFLLKSNQLDSKIFHTKFLLGLCYLEVNNLEESKKYFLECLVIDKNVIEVYQNIIYIFYIRGDRENANFYIKEAEKIKLYNPKIIELKTLINKFYENDLFVKELEKIFNQETGSENKAIYGYSLARIFDFNKNYTLFKKYLKISNDLKRESFKNYNFENHLQQFYDLKEFFSKEKDNLFINISRGENFFSKIPIFIVGMPRSGSTLVEQILSSHSNVFSLGEVDFFSESVNEILNSSSIEDFCNKLMSKNNYLAFEQIAKLYLKKTSVFEMGNKEYFTDKMLINFKLIPLIKLCFPNAKMIHSYRNAKDNCLSILKTNFQRSFMPWAYNEIELVKFYKMYSKVVNSYDKILKNQIFHIKYEDLVQNQNIQIENVLNFCDLPFEKNCINFFENKRDVRTASALQVRNKIYTSSIDQWKKYENCFSEMFQSLN